MSSIVSHAPEKNPGTENTFRAKASFKLSPPFSSHPSRMPRTFCTTELCPFTNTAGKKEKGPEKSKGKKEQRMETEWKLWKSLPLLWLLPLCEIQTKSTSEMCHYETHHQLPKGTSASGGCQATDGAEHPWLLATQSL